MVSGGQWANYVRAPAFRLQQEFPGVVMRGANIVTHGTIPVGSGLSSSSAIVVGAAEALIAINELPVRPAAMVDLCGEGEWFVGTRGGSGDHAAIKFARRGQVAHVSFFPFEVKEFVPFFDDHCLIICNSGIQAKKSEGARETFNRKVLGYVVGEILFKRFFPHLADQIQHLRDINCDNLGLELPELYRMLKALPVQIGADELFERYGPFSDTETEKLQNILSAVNNRTMPYDVRSLLIYGLAECERSRRCPELLRQGDANTLGRWWNLSHDGDRVVGHDENWHPHPFGGDVSDDYLDGLVTDLESQDATRAEGAQLHLQRGCYACSTPEIDLIVDLALRLPGVKGAQISGAGLGGCVMILVDNEHRTAALQALRSRALEAIFCSPVEGAGPVSI
jgi:N-acetylgalactosamine kinase